MGKVLRREQCPLCAAEGHDLKNKNNLYVYEDGGKYCHARHGVLERSDGGVPDRPAEESEFFSQGTYVDLSSRRIYSDVCKKYRYQVVDGEEYTNAQGKTRKVSGHVANYYKSGKLIAQKIREQGKVIWSVGNPNSGELFGQHTCRGDGKWLCITEGELDCLSVAQAHSHYDVVSIPGGASNAREAIQRNLEFVNGYEEVILCFDNDEAGQQAVDAVKDGLIRPGKLKIASLRYKDASDYLQKGKTKELVEDLWGAAKYCPPGIIASAEVDSKRDSKKVLSYFDPTLSRFMLGREVHTATAILSGTGSGKTTFLKQQMDHDLESGLSVGAILLEESPWDTMMDLASLRIGKHIRKILRQRKAMEVDPRIVDPMFVDDLNDDEVEEQFGWLKTRPLHLWNPDEAPSHDAILSRMEYMSLGLGCEAIYLDHMSLMQFKDKSEMDGLDDFAVKLKSLVLRCPSHFMVVSQLSQGDAKKSHEEGGKIVTRHMRGSQRVPSVFNEMMALQRNQQAEEDEDRNVTHLSCLKARLGGETGYITSYKYDKQSGRLNPLGLEHDPMPQPTGQQDFDMENL